MDESIPKLQDELGRLLAYFKMLTSLSTDFRVNRAEASLVVAQKAVDQARKRCAQARKPDIDKTRAKIESIHYKLKTLGAAPMDEPISAILPDIPMITAEVTSTATSPLPDRQVPAPAPTPVPEQPVVPEPVAEPKVLARARKDRKPPPLALNAPVSTPAQAEKAKAFHERLLKGVNWSSKVSMREFGTRYVLVHQRLAGSAPVEEHQSYARYFILDMDAENAQQSSGLLLLRKSLVIELQGRLSTAVKRQVMYILSLVDGKEVEKLKPQLLADNKADWERDAAARKFKEEQKDPNQKALRSETRRRYGRRGR